MFRQIWQTLVKWLQRLFRFGNRTKSKTSRHRQQSIEQQKAVRLPPPLAETDYEYLFMQLLEGVAHGWQHDRVEKFFEMLGDRGKQDLWIAWLHRFGERLLASPVPNNELAARMVQMGELQVGELGEVANDIGMQLLMRQPDGEENEQLIQNFSPMYVGYETNLDISQETSPMTTLTVDELLLMLQQDPHLAEQLASQMQIETTDPQMIIAELFNQQSNSR